MDFSSGLRHHSESHQTHGSVLQRDTHATPPQGIYDVFKKYQKMSDADVNQDLGVIDFCRGLTIEQKVKVRPEDTIAAESIKAASMDFLGCDEPNKEPHHLEGSEGAPCVSYSHTDFPGLRLFPSLLPPAVQIAFVDKLLHRDLSIPSHTTNLHTDYHIPYPASSSSSASTHDNESFFTLPESSEAHKLTPIDPRSNHQPLNIAQFLRKRWRWLTFGAQYNWTTRQYPPQAEVPTQFPPDIAKLVSSFFPRIRAESGVVLVYRPKDFMPVHRDVSELCERELCSITLGCDGLFIIALDQESEELDSPIPSNQNPHTNGEDEQKRPQKTVTIRVRSGDVVLMAGPTRWAWHAMPKVMGGTCPDFLHDWPVKPGMDPKDNDTRNYRKWKGYMSGKRINISCRQVYD